MDPSVGRNIFQLVAAVVYPWRGIVKKVSGGQSHILSLLQGMESLDVQQIEAMSGTIVFDILLRQHFLFCSDTPPKWQLCLL